MLKALLVLLVLIAPQPEAEAGVSACYPLGIKGEAYFRHDFVQRVPSAGWFIIWYCRQPNGSWTSTGRYCATCDQGAWLANTIKVLIAPDRGKAMEDLDVPDVTKPACVTEIAANTANKAICQAMEAAIADPKNWPSRNLRPQ